MYYPPPSAYALGLAATSPWFHCDMQHMCTRYVALSRHFLRPVRWFGLSDYLAFLTSSRRPSILHTIRAHYSRSRRTPTLKGRVEKEQCFLVRGSSMFAHLGSGPPSPRCRPSSKFLTNYRPHDCSVVPGLRTLLLAYYADSGLVEVEDLLP